MYRGTTPTLKFKLDIDISRITDLIVSFSQGGEVLLSKEKSEVLFEPETNSILVALTQEETLSFESNKDLHIQIKLKTDNNKVSSSKYINTYVNETLEETIL